MPLRISLYPVNRYIILPHIDHPCLAPIYIYIIYICAKYVLGIYCSGLSTVYVGIILLPVPVAMRGARCSFLRRFFRSGLAFRQLFDFFPGLRFRQKCSPVIEGATGNQ